MYVNAELVFKALGSSYVGLVVISVGLCAKSGNMGWRVATYSSDSSVWS